VNYLDGFSKNTQMQNFMKICPEGAEFFYADRRTDSLEEAMSRFSQICERAQKVCLMVWQTRWIRSKVFLFYYQVTAIYCCSKCMFTFTVNEIVPSKDLWNTYPILG